MDSSSIFFGGSVIAATVAGVLFPPGIFIDSEPFSYGRPSERKLRREFDRRVTTVQAELGDEV